MVLNIEKFMKGPTMKDLFIISAIMGLISEYGVGVVWVAALCVGLKILLKSEIYFKYQGE